MIVVHQAFHIQFWRVVLLMNPKSKVRAKKNLLLPKIARVSDESDHNTKYTVHI